MSFIEQLKKNFMSLTSWIIIVPSSLLIGLTGEKLGLGFPEVIIFAVAVGLVVGGVICAIGVAVYFRNKRKSNYRKSN
jgi:hypothetical protein